MSTLAKFGAAVDTLKVLLALYYYFFGSGSLVSNISGGIFGTN